MLWLRGLTIHYTLILYPHKCHFTRALEFFPVQLLNLDRESHAKLTRRACRAIIKALVAAATLVAIKGRQKLPLCKRQCRAKHKLLATEATMNKYLCISDEVQRALEVGLPVVALESTIISHGMPYPKNVETALAVEKIVRESGCVPATIAIIGGKLTVGCSEEQIVLLGKEGTAVTKVSRRDIPFVVAQKANGATTVAATMYVASLAGIEVFATGGIGGAHRGSEKTMDISADLDELQQTNVMVVCAGAKSILDIGLTLECLETRGVPVVGYQTEEMPAFYTRKSGFKTNYKLDTPKQIAEAFFCKNAVGLQGGMLVANPVPQQYAMDEKVIDEAISEALGLADSMGISGKNITPFLLDKIQQLTGGNSLNTNIELVFNNAKLASQIAVELCKLKAEECAK